MKKKKAIQVLVALAVLIVGLTGCGNKTASRVERNESSESSESNETTDETEIITIKAATGGQPRPYIYVDENNIPTGYDIEVLKEVFNRLPQYELEIEVTDFTSIFSGITSGIYQIGVNNFSYSEKRAESYLYSFPYDKISYVFVTKNGNNTINSFEQAAGKSFEGGAGVSVTTAVESWNEQNPDKAIHIAYTESDTAIVLQHVEDGTTEFAIIDAAMFHAFQEEFNFDIVATDIPENEAKLISENTYAYFLLSKDNAQLRDEIGVVLKELQADGTLSKLSQQYFDGEYVPEEDQFITPLN
ncbi:MAG: transporter substrate-binding domain-containing protein [Lachnospiraceae bacterium]